MTRQTVHTYKPQNGDEELLCKTWDKHQAAIKFVEHLDNKSVEDLAFVKNRTVKGKLVDGDVYYAFMTGKDELSKFTVL